MSRFFGRVLGVCFATLVCFSSCKNKGTDFEDKLPMLVFLKVGDEVFSDFSKKSFVVQKEVDANTESVVVEAVAEKGTVISYTPGLIDDNKWNVVSGSNTLTIKLSNGKENVYTVTLIKKSVKTLELKRLEIGSQKFSDLSSTKLLNADSIDYEFDKVRVIAEADSDVSIGYTPALDKENCWSLEVGENTLLIRLTRANESPVIYTVKILRKEQNMTGFLKGISAIKTATSEYGTTFPQDFSAWRETQIQKEEDKAYCIIDAIDPEDYIGFIFVLKTGIDIEKVEQKSMNATKWTKMYYTKDELVNQNTNTPYRVYYFAKYSFSKGYAEQASIKITYKDSTSDEFIVKAKNGIITE